VGKGKIIYSVLRIVDQLNNESDHAVAVPRKLMLNFINHHGKAGGR
jgi:hypothetical protein